MVKVSEQVVFLEQTIKFLEDKAKSSFEDGRQAALRLTRERVSGFTDGGAEVLMKYGLDGPDSYAAMDEIWDILKSLMKSAGDFPKTNP